MGRNKLTEAEKKLRGNPGKRDEPEEHEVDSPALRCPPGLSKQEKRYWHIWAPSLIEVGKITVLSVPSFLDLISLRVELDILRKALTVGDLPRYEKTSFVDSSGQEHSVIKESAPSKRCLVLTRDFQRLAKTWGVSGDGSAGLFKKKKKKSEEEEFLG
jgi:hypothetical protein